MAEGSPMGHKNSPCLVVEDVLRAPLLLCGFPFLAVGSWCRFAKADNLVLASVTALIELGEFWRVVSNPCFSWIALTAGLH